MSILQIRFFYYYFKFVDLISFSFLFTFSLFTFFFNVKNGETALYIAAQNGHEQIVQILLEEGKANADLANKSVFFFFSFLFFSLSHFSIFFM